MPFGNVKSTLCILGMIIWSNIQFNNSHYKCYTCIYAQNVIWDLHALLRVLHNTYNVLINVPNVLTLSLILILAPFSSKLRMISIWPLFEAL